MALNHKYSQTYDKWVKEKAKSVYVRINDEYKDFNFKFSGWLHSENER